MSDASDVALHFVKIKEWRATPAVMKKTVQQAKSLLDVGFTKEEIILGLNYIVDVEKVNIYSLGYLNHTLNGVLDKIKEAKHKEDVKKVTEPNDLVSSTLEFRGGLNEGKLQRTHHKSGFGTRVNLDLFKKS